jgi:hypothetical protein
LLKPGANYGYEADCEGNCGKAGMENPIVTYSHNVGRCITGAAFYQANAFPPESKGSLFWSDWGASWIKRRAKDGKTVAFNKFGGVIQMDVGPDGNLYLLKINGQDAPWGGSVLKVRYTGKAVSLGSRSARRRTTGSAQVSYSASVRTGTATGAAGMRVRLGLDPPKDASLGLYDAEGHRVGNAPVEGR